MSVTVGIVGAGPAGLVLAATLAKRSYAFSVKVFEQGADHNLLRAAVPIGPTPLPSLVMVLWQWRLLVLSSSSMKS